MRTVTFNLLFRGLTVGSKFLLAIFIAKFLSLEELGIYGIILVSVNLSLYLVGLDFYAYSNRSILQSPIETRRKQLKNQWFFYGLSYLVFLPSLSLIFFLGVIDWEFIVLFYSLLITEHIALELYRLLVTFSKPVLANISLFLRSGLWGYIILSLWFLDIGDFKDLHSLLKAWLIFSAISVVVSLLFVRTVDLGPKGDNPIDWKWIKTGILVCMPYLIATIANRTIEFSDRYMIDYWWTKEDVGVYTFFSGIGNLVETFTQATVLMIYSPKLISSFNENKNVFKKHFKSFKNQLWVVNIIAGVGSVVFCYPLLSYLDKPELSENFNTLIVLVLAKVLYNFSMIFHYYLYVQKQDLSIIYSMVSAAIANVVLNLFFVPYFGLIGAAFATLISFAIVLVAKYYFYKRLKPAL